MRSLRVSERLRYTLLAALTGAGLWMAGCGDSRQQYVFTGTGTGNGPIEVQPPAGTFELAFQNIPAPEGVDSAQLVYRNSAGQQLGEVLEVPFNGRLSAPIPTGAAKVEVDYLRNGGYGLFESEHNLQAPNVNAQAVNAQAPLATTVVDPQLMASKGGRSVWTSRINPARFQLAVEGNPGKDAPLSDPSDFKVKGVAYSPTSIGIDVTKTPHLGDYFWDGWNIQGAGMLNDWTAVWQRDIEKIRGHFNSVRLYTMLAVHINDNGSLPDFNNPTVRTHLKFLDAMWNNGDRPVYCLVGIPVNPGIYDGTASPAEVKFWNENVARLVAQLKDHPAVMGFTIFNEVGGGEQWGHDTAKSNTYWGQIQTFSKQIKEVAPDKLVGFAYFDAPPDVADAHNAGLLSTYGQYLDFWGVNAAQAETLSGTLAPYRTLGEATKPVLFTELGNPASSHADQSMCDEAKKFPTQAGADSIYIDDTTIAKAAQALRNVLPLAVSDDISAGAFVFEWNDEYWKQTKGEGCFAPRGADVQDGGKGADVGAKANGYDDEEAYGLHGIALSNGRAASDVFTAFGKGTKSANLNPDTLTVRQPMMDAVDAAFQPVR
jgi:hypothetical protein